MNNVKFLFDADINQKIIEGLRHREPTIDLWNPHEAAIIGLADPDVLAVAAGAGRALISHDYKTMPGHFARFRQKAESPGLIMLPQSLDIGPAIEDLLLIWEVMEPHELRNQIRYIRGA